MARTYPLVLVVEDDPSYVRLIKINLETSGYTIKSTDNGSEAVEITARYQPDLILLDIMLKGEKDGFQVCREIRRFSSVPIIMLTALNGTNYIVQGLDSGADDYVPKPFSAQELMARVRARFRRWGSGYDAVYPDDDLFEVSGLKVDFGQQRVYVEGRERELTPTEYRLLSHLVRNKGRVMTTMNLLERVWDIDQHDAQLLWQAIYRLRHKIEPDPEKPRYIHTRPGIGYIFVDEEEKAHD